MIEEGRFGRGKASMCPREKTLNHGQNLFCRAAPQQAHHQALSLQGLFFPWCGAGHLSHNVELHGVLLAHSSSLSGSLFMAALSSNILAGPSNLLSSGNPMRVPSVASSRSLRKMWNRTGPRINSCDTHYWPSGSI